MAAHAQNGSASPVVKPLVDYPDDDDDDVAMDMKPEAREQERQGTFGHAASPAEATPASPPVQTPPERLSEKRRREEEDEDELIKLTTTPKRRSSSASSGDAGLLRGKRSMSFEPTDKGAAQGLINNMTTSAAPKRIAINLGSTTARSPSTETSSTRLRTPERGEKDSQEDSQAGEGG